MTRKTVILVEDNATQAVYLCKQLEHTFMVKHYLTGEDCLDYLQENKVDVVILDVKLTGIDGYETCRRLKQHDHLRKIPVIFLSSSIEMSDRLAGYQAGGHDYLTKPVSVPELISKIEVFLKEHDDLALLEGRITDAFNAAMHAMSSAADLGAIMQAMRMSYSSKDYEDITGLMLAVTRQFDLEASVQIRGKYGSVCHTRNGPCAPLELVIFNNLADQGRLVDLGNHTAINFERVSLIVKNMPIQNPERYGRVKDSLAFLVEGMDARLRALDSEIELSRQNQLVTQLARMLTDRLANTAQSRNHCQSHCLHLLTDLETSLISRIDRFGLSEIQMTLVRSTLSEAVEQGRNLVVWDDAQDEQISDLLKQFQRN